MSSSTSAPKSAPKSAIVSPPKKIAVVLSGCGYLDGSEITEAVSVLIALSELGTEISCFAPDQEFPSAVYVAGHSSRDESTTEMKTEVTISGDTSSPVASVGSAKRNALEESGRIARGHVHALTELHEKDFDGVVFPGGAGAAKNLSSWATLGAKTPVHAEVKRVIKEFHKSMKPIGAICIAPILVARVLGPENPEITLGNDEDIAAEVSKMGVVHTKCAVDDYVSDRDHKILTTPAYMYDSAKPHEVFMGIKRMLTELVEMA